MSVKYKKTNAFFKTNAQSMCGCPMKTHDSTGQPRTCTFIPTYHSIEENRWTCGIHVKKPKICDEAECSVCLCDIPKKQIQTLPCGHVFHKMCVKKWTLRGKDTCPLCRAVYPVAPHLVPPRLGRLEPEDIRWAAAVLEETFGPNPRLDVWESLLSINTVFAPHFQLVMEGDVVMLVEMD